MRIAAFVRTRGPKRITYLGKINMIGQGSPEFVCVCCKGRGNTVAAKPLLWLLTLCAMLACVQAVAAPPKPLDLRLRVAWGGGTVRLAGTTQRQCERAY